MFKISHNCNATRATLRTSQQVKKRKKYIQDYNLKAKKWQNKEMLSIILCSIDLISFHFAHLKVFKTQISNLWWRPRPQGEDMNLNGCTGEYSL